MKKLICILMMGLMLAGCGKETQLPQESGDAEQVTQQQETEQEMSEDETQNAETGEVTETPKESGQIYTYEDMTITFPDSWEGKYIVKDGENGFAIMQKSSYEKEEGWGFLFGFYRSGEMVDESTGATQLAYTNDCVYYVQEPTDVTFWYDDETISNEYMEMVKDKEKIIRSLSVAAEGVKYDAREYVLAVSDIKPIPEYYLENYSEHTLWLARNEIYARHGREFTNAYLANYFASCSWYTPTVPADAFDESVLSQIEKDNLEIIKQYEDRAAKAKSYPQSCQFGKEYSYDLDGDGNKETFELSYRENTETYMYDVTMVLDGDMAIELSSDEVFYFYPNTEKYFVTDISPHYEGLEIAVMDYGMSEDLVTHFYSYDGQIHYLGCVGGFPFKEYMNRDGFMWDGGVIGTTRTDLIHTCFSYTYSFYDYKAKRLDITEDQMLEMVPTGAHDLMQDIPVRIIQHPESETVIMKAQPIFFLETDGLEWIKIKGKDGTEGYLYIIDGKIDGVEENPQDIISGLFFAG